MRHGLTSGDFDHQASRLQRQLALAVKSNTRMRQELAELRPEFQRKLRVERSRRFEQQQRAEMWKHRALNK